ncbi:hypothetical protein [Corynebacterium nuruki]
MVLSVLADGAAQSVFVTVFNAAVAGGGLVGGGLLAGTGTASSLG